MTCTLLWIYYDIVNHTGLTELCVLRLSQCLFFILSFSFSSLFILYSGNLHS